MMEQKEAIQMSYDKIFPKEVIQLMQDLAEADYSMDDMVEFIEKYGQKEFLENYEFVKAYEYDYKIDSEVLYDYYSGFDFLDLEFWGKYNSKEHFAKDFCYYDDVSDYLYVDWEKTIENLEKEFDMIESESKTIVIRKN